MKKFIRNIILFTLTLFLMINICAMIPSRFYTYRHWEALTYNKIKLSSYGAFYPNAHFKRTEYGDLAHHTKYSLKKKNITWKTDRLGFRNDEFIKNPDILLIGDSNLVGSGVSQENTLANLINKKTKNKAYSIAPKGIKTFHQLLMRGIIKRPKLVIYQSVERNLLKLKDVNKLENGLKTRLKAKLKFWHLTYLDKLLTQGLLKYIKARVLNQSGRSISSQSSVDPSFFYLKSSDHIIPKNKSNLDRVTKRILQYKKYFNNQNIDFIFLPTPNKKTIYHDLVPLQKRPDFLVDLIKSLRKNKVKVIETYDLFLKSQDLLYHKDDSHWNEKAIKLVFKEISRLHNLM